MRGFGDFQRMQLRRTDPRVNELFGHLRKAIDVMEQMILRPCSSEERHPTPMAPQPALVAAEPASPKKVAYRIKEVTELVGLSRSAVYSAIRAKELRAVKRASTTLVLAKDLRRWMDRLPSR
jgi:excisionase family DNA binding protein